MPDAAIRARGHRAAARDRLRPIVEKPLTHVRAALQPGLVRKAVILVLLAVVWEAVCALSRQSAAGADLSAKRSARVRDRHDDRRDSAARLDIAEGAGAGLHHRRRCSPRSSRCWRSPRASAPISSKP